MQIATPDFSFSPHASLWKFHATFYRLSFRYNRSPDYIHHAVLLKHFGLWFFTGNDGLELISRTLSRGEKKSMSHFSTEKSRECQTILPCRFFTTRSGKTAGQRYVFRSHGSGEPNGPGAKNVAEQRRRADQFPEDRAR